jgi:L-seryl-tRNA(Ser) seleniumtransferase
MNNLYANLPKMDQILLHFSSLEIDPIWLKEIASEHLDMIRKAIKAGTLKEVSIDDIFMQIEEKITVSTQSAFRNVINGSGIVIHTNLGRSIIHADHFDQIKDVLTHYHNLEFNLDTGKRGSRYDLVTSKLCRLTGAEAALVVNNNAAAVLLVLSALSEGKKAIVSRGELVEIGGSFRIPEVMKLSGCTLVEVGTTNKTHLVDYRNVIDDDTTMMMKVHTSNYKIVGFTASVDTHDLYPLCQEHKIILYDDLGSGMITALDLPIFKEEQLIKERLKNCDILSFSGDKLLGGPQCGIIVGKKVLIDRLKHHQLLRALRIDKVSLALLDQLLMSYFKKSEFMIEEIPTLSFLTRKAEDIEKQVAVFLETFRKNHESSTLKLRKINLISEVGAGSLPTATLASYGVAIEADQSPDTLMQRMRDHSPAIIGRIHDQQVILDFRTIAYEDHDTILAFLDSAGGVLC